MTLAFALTFALSAAALPSPSALQTAEASVPALESTRIEAFGESASRLVTDAKEKNLIALTARGVVLCVERESGTARWNADVSNSGQMGIGSLYDIALGGDLLAVSLGVGAVDWLDVQTGERKEVHGVPAIGTASCVLTDPKDRWTWLGFREGGVARLNPGNINDYSRRGVEGGGVHCLAQDSGAGLIAIGCADGGIRFLNPKSATVDKKKLLAADDRRLTALCFVDKTATLASGSEGGRVHVWKVSNGKELAAIAGHTAAITALAADPKGRRLAVGDASGRVGLYDAASGERLAELHAPAEENPVGDLLFLDKGERLAGALRGRGVLVWDLSGL